MPRRSAARSAAGTEAAQAADVPVGPPTRRAPATRTIDGERHHASAATASAMQRRAQHRRPSAGAAASAGLRAAAVQLGRNELEIKLPPGADSEEVREAIEDGARGDRRRHRGRPRCRRPTRRSRCRRRPSSVARSRACRADATCGDCAAGAGVPVDRHASIILKITYKGRLQAEVKAAQATETAESESLKRQVVEARMAAMQAQVEPHFLFNTLASIDHLIETDPARASEMQKNLIALLRASMPTMREASDERRARPRPRAGGDPALPRDPEGAHGRAADDRDRRARRPAVGRVPADDDPDAWSRTPSSTAWSPRPRAAR